MKYVRLKGPDLVLYIFRKPPRPENMLAVLESLQEGLKIPLWEAMMMKLGLFGDHKMLENPEL